MPHIRQLEPHIADLIAAGEVVERPASVVKELVENAIDAGASAVVVETRNGGMGLIRVTDNGCGIAPAELPTAFLRHATSKLRSAEDLGRIGTLGFRGEALAAISAVSRVDILTRQTGAPAGVSLHLEGGVPGQVTEAGAPEGTTITVRDLFYNTPARLKFMKKDSAETAAVNGLMQHLALSHPHVSFKYIKDGADALHTPGDGKLNSAVYAALGRDFAKSLVEIHGGGGEVSVSGFVTKPLFCRGSRGMQIFFVNGRFIKSQLLTAALEEGYRNQMMKGKFPGCVLAVTLPTEAVDVNVHPAKTQVKFAREREVFDAVYHTVLDALEADSRPAPVPVKEPAKTMPPRQDFFQTMDARTFRESRPTEMPPPPERPVRRSEPTVTPKLTPPPKPTWNTEWARTRVADSAPKTASYQVRPAMGSAPASVRPVEKPAPAVPAKQPETAPAKDVPVIAEAARKPAPIPAIPAVTQDTLELPGQETLQPPAEAPWRIAGEILRTYIVCESEEGCVWLIDKHAAHERINFDRLMAAKEPPVRQLLLRPIVADLDKEISGLLLENLALLETLGFTCEDFGDGAILVREVPADTDPADTVATLEELAEDLRTGRSPEERRENLFHTMACKAAIKGGWVSDPAELKVLVEQVQSGAVRYCPHGRPVAVKLTKYELEKMFKRA